MTNLEFSHSHLPSFSRDVDYSLFINCLWQTLHACVSWSALEIPSSKLFKIILVAIPLQDHGFLYKYIHIMYTYILVEIYMYTNKAIPEKSYCDEHTKLPRQYCIVTTCLLPKNMCFFILFYTYPFFKPVLFSEASWKAHEWFRMLTAAEEIGQVKKRQWVSANSAYYLCMIMHNLA